MWFVAVVGRCVVGCEHCSHPTTSYMYDLCVCVCIYIYIYIYNAVGSSKFVHSSTGFSSLFFFRNVLFLLLECVGKAV